MDSVERLIEQLKADREASLVADRTAVQERFREFIERFPQIAIQELQLHSNGIALIKHDVGLPISHGNVLAELLTDAYPGWRFAYSPNVISFYKKAPATQ